MVLNLSHTPRGLAWSEPGGRIVLSSYLDRAEESVGDRLEARAGEGILLSCSQARNAPAHGRVALSDQLPCHTAAFDS